MLVIREFKWRGLFMCLFKKINLHLIFLITLNICSSFNKLSASRLTRKVGRKLFNHGLISKTPISPVYKVVKEKIENFDCVENGKLYRSAQLKPKKLEKIIRNNNIKVVINLRGENPNAKWYNAEIDVCKKLGVEHYDIAMSAKQYPSKENLQKLLHIFDYSKTNNKPVLIHCRAGRDRTGLACALWELYMGKSKKEAEKQLSLKYLHIEKLYPMPDRLINMWQGRDWLNNGGYEAATGQNIENKLNKLAVATN